MSYTAAGICPLIQIANSQVAADGRAQTDLNDGSSYTNGRRQTTRSQLRATSYHTTAQFDLKNRQQDPSHAAERARV